MSDESNADRVAKWWFYATLAGCVLYVTAVLVFVMGSEPAGAAQGTGHHD